MSRTWARQGHQPTVKTTGKRRGYKVFGFIEYFSGRLFSQGQDGRFDSASYQAFICKVLAATGQHVFLIQEGAKYHTSQSTRECFEQHQERITVCQLPSYSPDYNPIEYLWRKTKKQATHNKYFEHYEQLVAAVNQALDHFAVNPAAVLSLFGCYDDEPRLKLQHPT